MTTKMIKIYLYSFFILATILVCFSGNVMAQTSNSGPSDTSTPPTTPPPVSGSTLAKILCFGDVIQIKSNTSSAKYLWYKLVGSDYTLISTTTSPTDSYTEQSEGSGYYRYKLVLENESGCQSPMSDEISVFVLPELTVSIDANGSNPVVCAQNQSSTILKAVTPAGYTYTYQWYREGVLISNATSDSYEVKEANVGNVSYTVKVGYTLNTSCQKESAPVVVKVSEVPAKPVISVGL